ncbi:glycosyltransferase family 2 protein [Paenibacillus sp. y28]|uniref:glycosyltransferase family 2 protein n=1 Tax=Paenibacillus sp. y28 TaxID=3129110 RepID=UPI0030196B75
MAVTKRKLSGYKKKAKPRRSKKQTGKRRILSRKPAKRQRNQRKYGTHRAIAHSRLLRQAASLRQPAGQELAWAGQAYAAGQLAAKQRLGAESGGHQAVIDAALQQSWTEWFSAHKPPGMSWLAYTKASSRFASGFAPEHSQADKERILLPTAKSVAAIVCVKNEEETISMVLKELLRIPFHELIFIVNGSTDGSFRSIRQCPKTMILHYPEPLGHDVGRALGAKLSQADILLFLDGDIPILAEKLLPFIHAVEQGMDIALNDISPFLPVFSRRDHVSKMKQFLNRTVCGSDLGVSSMTAIPHAVSRRAIETLGTRELMVPPKAQALARQHGLKVGAPCSVDVISSNKVRDTNSGPGNKMHDFIIGDHLEALNAAMERSGARLGFPDTIRNRIS